MALLCLSLLLLSCMSAAYSEETCDAIQDPTVYTFAYGYNSVPYSYMNKDDKLAGTGPDVVRMICKAMNKKCENIVIYDYSIFWDRAWSAHGLNNRWFTAQLSYLPTQKRLSGYAFFGEYLNEQLVYVYVRRDSGMNSIDDVKSDAETFGFRTSFYTDDSCLETHLGVSLAGKALFYPNEDELEAALIGGEVDAIFVGDPKIQDRNAIRQIPSESLECASGGPSVVTRKDMLEQFAWFDEGLAKIRANGDYDWMCNIHKASGPDPRCL